MKLKRFYKRLVTPLVQVRPFNVRRYFRYFNQLFAYRSLGGRTEILWPVLGEDTPTTTVDPHYFYQGVWAARHIVKEKPESHVDVGSQTDLIGFLTAITPIVSVELRPLSVSVENLESVRGSILKMPFPNDSVQSLSCLHVAEHIGLGRYGDPLDPDGTRKACSELARVLAPGGILYFSVPIGRERTEFNAHRVHDPRTIAGYFPNLVLREFSAVNDAGQLIHDADISSFASARYACGLFRFVKEVPRQ